MLLNLHQLFLLLLKKKAAMIWIGCPNNLAAMKLSKKHQLKKHQLKKHRLLKKQVSMISIRTLSLL